MPLASLLLGLAPLLSPAPQDPDAPGDGGAAPAPVEEDAARNRLAGETSPYLLQHADDPVDWHPWGERAIALARELDRPIFLSIGYSACHWCHVMERESFEDEAIADFLNRHFVPIKVDREERPDLDAIYMRAVQRITGAGGWPLTVFLTPELEPFFGGTYFPPEPRLGHPGFLQLLEKVATLWEMQRASIEEDATRLTAMLVEEAERDASGALDASVLDRSLAELASRFDEEWGGFGAAPKFPRSVDLRLCLRHAKRTGDPRALVMATTTLARMARGGVYDQLAGGFARYSTDRRWLVPHFEKMLYDNALLVPAYLEAYLATGNELYARIARECCAWIAGEMRTPSGGFASSLDADTEGEEGKYYVWTPEELLRVLGEERGAWAAEWFDVRPEGNFDEGASVLSRHAPAAEVAATLGVEEAELVAAMEEARAELLAARSERVPPAKDDKVLAAWNGLAISALSRAHQVLGEERWLAAARDAARFVLDRMRREDGRLRSTARGGKARLEGTLDDYAFVIQGLLDLWESDFDPRWIREAIALEAIASELFEDPERGGWFQAVPEADDLLVRLRSEHDGALPAGGAVMASALVRLFELTGEAEFAERFERTFASVGAAVRRAPMGYGRMLLALDLHLAGPRQIVVAGARDDEVTRGMLRAVRTAWLPHRVVALWSGDQGEDLLPLYEGRPVPEEGATAYVCRGFVCDLPVDSVAALREQLESGAPASAGEPKAGAPGEG